MTGLFSLKICNPLWCRWPPIYTIYTRCRWVKQTEQAVESVGVCKERLFLNTFSSFSNAERIKNVLFVLVTRHLYIIIYDVQIKKCQKNFWFFYPYFKKCRVIGRLFYFLKIRIKNLLRKFVIYNENLTIIEYVGVDTHLHQPLATLDLDKNFFVYEPSVVFTVLYNSVCSCLYGVNW